MTQIGRDITSPALMGWCKLRPRQAYVPTGDAASPYGWSWQAAPSAAGPDNTIYMSDYANSTAGVQGAIDDAANKMLVWDCARTVTGTVTVSNPTHILGIGANATVEGAGSEDDRGIATLIASGNLDPLIDIASDGVTVDDVLFDGDASSSTLMRWACKYGRILGCEFKYASVGLELINQWDYTNIIQCRLMAGLTKAIQIDLNHGSSYNNAHTIILGCHLSATSECVDRVAGGSGTAYDFRFIGCDFHDGHDVNYMLDMSNLHYSTFTNCNFELHATTPPGVGVVYCEAIGLAFHGCLFGGRNIGAMTCLVGGSYEPIDVSGSTFANWYAGQTLMSGVDFANVDSCNFYNTAAATVIAGGARRGDHAWT